MLRVACTVTALLPPRALKICTLAQLLARRLQHAGYIQGSALGMLLLPKLGWVLVLIITSWQFYTVHTHACCAAIMALCMARTMCSAYVWTHVGATAAVEAHP